MPRTSQIREKRQALLPVVARAFSELGYRRATTAQLAQRCGVQENILYRLWPDKKAMFLAAIDFVYEFSERTWLNLLQEPGRAGESLLPDVLAKDGDGAPGGDPPDDLQRVERRGSRSRRGAHVAPVLPSGARRLLAFETLHHGEFGHYRILFTGLAETDDADIRDALRRVFARFHRFLAAQIATHRMATNQAGAQTNAAIRGRANVNAGPAREAVSIELAAWAVIGLGTVANIGRELGLLTGAQRQALLAEAGHHLLEGAPPA